MKGRLNLFPQTGGVFQFGPVNERIRLVPCLERNGIPARQVARTEDERGQRRGGKRVIEKTRCLHGVHDTPLFRLQRGNSRFCPALVVCRPFLNIRKRIFFPPRTKVSRQFFDCITVILGKTERDIAVIVDKLRGGNARLTHTVIQSGRVQNGNGYLIIGSLRCDFGIGKILCVADIRPKKPHKILFVLGAENGIRQRGVTELDIGQTNFLHDKRRIFQIDGIAHLIGRLFHAVLRRRTGTRLCVDFLRLLHYLLRVWTVRTKRRLRLLKGSETTSGCHSKTALFIVPVMVIKLPVGILLDGDGFIAVSVTGDGLNHCFRLRIPDVSGPQAMLKHLPAHEHLIPPRLVGIDVENVVIRDTCQDDLFLGVLGMEREPVPDSVFQRRQFCFFYRQPVSGVPFRRLFPDLCQIILRLPLAGKFLGNAGRVHIDFLPDVIPNGIAVIGLDQEEPLRRGVVAPVRDLRRLCQHLACMVGRVRQFRGGGHDLIGLVKQGLMETVAVLRHIEVEPHEARVLNGEGGLFNGFAALQISSLFVVVVTGIPIGRVPQEGVPDNRVIPLINLCRGRRKAVTGSGERDSAESGVIPFQSGIPHFIRVTQILVILNQRPNPFLDLRPAQTGLRVVSGVPDHQALGTGLHVAAAAIGKLPASTVSAIESSSSTLNGWPSNGWRSESGICRTVSVMASAVAPVWVSASFCLGLGIRVHLAFSMWVYGEKKKGVYPVPRWGGIHAYVAA